MGNIGEIAQRTNVKVLKGNRVEYYHSNIE